MGTHPNGPAHLYDDPETSLISLVKSDPEHFLGQALMKKWPDSIQIPYLFKVLSISKALPLQAHPDVRLAQKLNNENRKEFVDANHKPEIAIAIGEPLGSWGDGVTFAGFVGFKPLDQIKKSLESVSELCGAIGDEALVEAFIAHPSQVTLKKVFSALLIRGANEPDAVKNQISALLLKIKPTPGESISSRAISKEAAELIEKIGHQYPGDVGVLATTFFMNFEKLRKGEAIYIGADEIHAYLEGDIIECMATSDNVLNAAFAPRSETKRHLPTFVEMLTYTSRAPSQWTLPNKPYPRSENQTTTMCEPPFEEFVVLRTILRVGDDKEKLAPVCGPMIGIVTQGCCRLRSSDFLTEEELTLEIGSVAYVVPGTELQIELMNEGIWGNECGGEIWWAAYTG